MRDITVNAEVQLDFTDIPKREWNNVARQINELPNISEFKYDAENGYVDFETDVSVESYDVSFETYTRDGWDALRGEYRPDGHFTDIIIDDLVVNTPERDILNINKNIIIDIYYNKEIIEEEIKEYVKEM